MSVDCDLSHVLDGKKILKDFSLNFDFSYILAEFPNWNFDNRAIA